MRPWQTAAVAVLVFLLAFSALLILSPSSEGQERTLRFALTPSEETSEPQMKRSSQVVQRLEKDLDLHVIRAR
jgi:ABC-type phosphate/phosphonate transport system substrate-binding protein